MDEFIIQLDHDSSKTLCREVVYHEEFLGKLKIHPLLKEALCENLVRIKRILDKAKVVTKEKGG